MGRGMMELCANEHVLLARDIFGLCNFVLNNSQECGMGEK